MLLFDVFMIFALIILDIIQLYKHIVGNKYIVWVNFGLATTVRILIVGMRIVFEFIVKWISRSTMYAITALFSFIYSSHTLPPKEFPLMVNIVLYVDVSLLGILFLYVFMIKLCAKKFHKVIFWKKLFFKISILAMILYGLFIVIVALFNHIHRARVKHEYWRASLFYFECGHLLLYCGFFAICKYKKWLKKYECKAWSCIYK